MVLMVREPSVLMVVVANLRAETLFVLVQAGGSERA